MLNLRMMAGFAIITIVMGCGIIPIPAPATVDWSSPPATLFATLMPDEGIAVVPGMASPRDDADLLPCTGRGLQAHLPGIRIIESNVAYALGLPDFSRALEPLAQHLPDEMTSRRLVAAGMRLVVLVNAFSKEYYTGQFTPSVTRYRASYIKLRMIDLRERSISDTVEVQTSGREGNSLALFTLLPPTETTACDKATQLLATGIRRKKPEGR